MTEVVVEQRKKHIMFVDDDEKLLAGLKRGLRATRDVWDISFANGGEEALDLLKEKETDLIVADVKMPNIDGCTLLEMVREQYPHIMRVVLSGETGDEMGHKALKVANQCLAKPCGVEQLKIVIEELLKIQSRLGNGLLKDAITNLATLPSIPQQYWDLKDAIDSPTSTSQGISDVISKDMAMAAKILQLSNSAFFGVASGRITSLPMAITMLGVDLISQLALVSNVFSAYDPTICPEFSMENLWEQSMKVSHLAKSIAVAEKVPRDIQEATLLGGLLCHMGKLALATCVPKDYGELLREFEEERKNGNSISLEEELDREQKAFDTTHPDVGAYMAGVWGLPEIIVDAVSAYHAPDKVGQQKGLTPVLIVSAAAAIIDDRLESPSGFAVEKALDDVGCRAKLNIWMQMNQENSDS